MIALQTRNPQLPDPSRITAQYANMMNMASQQRASQLQGERIRQEMDYARAGEGRAIETQTATMREKSIDIQEKEMKRLGRVGVAVLRTEDPALREAAYQTLLGEVEKADPRLGATMRQVAPTFNAAVVESAVMEVDKYFNAKYPNATYSNEIADAGGFDAQGRPIPAGTLLQVRNSVVPEVAPIPSATAARTATPVPTAAPQQTTSSPVPVGKYGETRFAPDGGPLTPDLQENLRQMKEGLGMTDTPASFNSGGMATPTAGPIAPDVMASIVDSAFQTGVMAQVDFDQIIAAQPPQNRQALTDAFQQANISLQADAPSLAASGMGQQPMAPNPVGRQQSQFADMRGPAPQASFADLGGQPQMQNTMAQYQPVQRRDPRMAPTPVPVPPAILGAQEGAKTAASKSVDLRMDPEIAGATKKVENAIALRAEAPKAKYETKILVQGLDKYINAIDTLLRSPDRHLIVGRIEGNLHYLGSLGQNERQAELQAMYDMIKNTDTLSTLVEMKQSTPSGGSPVGNASNTDVTLVAKSANAATQTGGVPNFDKQLMAIRRDAYRARTNAIEFYSDKYGGLAAEDPKFKFTAPPIADRYTGPLKTPVIPTLTPAQVRANPKIKRWKRSDNGKVMTRP